MNKQQLKTVYTLIKEYVFEQDYIQDLDGEFYLKQQLITFTPEEYNQHIQDVIKDALDTVSDKVMLRVTPYDEEEYLDTATKSSYLNENHVDGFEIDVDRESIINTFEETFKKFKYE